MKRLPKASSTARRVYTNRKQKQFLAGRQKRKTFVGGRGSGKSATIGFENYQRSQAMPRGKSFIAAMTFDQLLTKSWPSVKEAWGMLGLYEYDPKSKMGHYVVCKKPPQAWPKPYLVPGSYDHCITLINGYTIELMSINGIQNRRGGSYDAGDLDESALAPEDVLTQVLEPSLRGNSYAPWAQHPLHWSMCDYTSAPWKPEGQWVFKTEELAKETPDKVLFVEATVYDNVAIWGGKKRLDELRDRVLKTNPMSWHLEYMNKRLSKMPNSFYPAFSTTKHSKSVDWVDYKQDPVTGIFTGKTDFLDKSLPLETSWDFNAGFTSLIVCQEVGDEVV